MTALPVLPNPYTFAQALATRDAETCRQQIISDMVTMGVDVVGFDPFGVDVALISIDATAASHADIMRASVTMGGYMHLAPTDDFVDAVAAGWFAEKRIPGKTAIIKCPVTCAGSAGPYTFKAGSGQLVAIADDGLLYQSSNEVDVTIPSGGTKQIRFTCRTAGAAGNQVSGAITRFIAAPPGLTITNAGGSIVLAGRDAESNQDFRRRCFGKWGILGAGWTKTAFDYLIPFYADTLNRWFVDDSNPLGPGSLQLWLANPAGPASPDEVSKVLAGLSALDRKPFGTGRLGVNAAIARTLPVDALIFGDGTNGSLLGDATDALEQLQTNFPIGGFLAAELMIGILEGGAFAAYGIPGYGGVIGPSGGRDPMIYSGPLDTQLSVFEVLDLDVTLLAVSQ